MTNPKIINYHYNSLQEAVQAYHALLNRLETWAVKYPNYSFEIYLLTSGIKRMPTVKIEVTKHAQA